MNFKIVSFGKKMENLKTAIEHKVIGSEHSSFLNKLDVGDLILFNCSSAYWGMATISSEGFESRERIWKDKPYPYRFNIDQIVFLKRSFSFKEKEIDSDLREILGKGWAFKIVFFPNEIPKKINQKIKGLIDEIGEVSPSEMNEWLEKIVSENNQKRRKKLGLD